ncbi:helix-turn-helix domain-containing protein [Limisphaera sp. 4302-co]|uniref:helix-turn-helix domain-containing protein n=1 Tax=Limisphaera sp. 4302-co TaxID=3400417 RepID=UPI003C266920
MKVRRSRKGMVGVRLPEGEEEWLELAMRCGFRVKAMAAVLEVGERTLRRRFRREVKERLWEWLRRTRMEVGRRWLREGTFVKEVAGRLGYGSVSAFCRAYRRRWGRSPCEERERAR